MKRRAFLRRGLVGGVTGAAGVVAGAGAGSAAGVAGAEGVAGAAHEGVPGRTGESAAPVPFHGVHQAGVVQEPRRHTLVAAFDVIADGRRELVELMRELTDRARAAMSGGPPDEPGIAAPSKDSGVLGPGVPAGGLTATVGLGASLFDDRYGLAGRRPSALRPMRMFPNDDLRADWCHGDLSLQLSADDEDTVLHALRDIARNTRGGMQLRWRLGGFASPPRPSGTPRNLMGFKDGIANPASKEYDRLVWLDDGPAAGGTYVVYRLIRMFVEFWDRVAISEQENMIGRTRDTGAPLDGHREQDIPRYADDPTGSVIPLTSHIRLANPHTRQTDGQRILRRSFNYDRGIDEVGDLDMGLLFCCYQRDPRRQFEAVQERLIDEPLVDYISPFGGGYFLVLPGVRNEEDFLGRSLLA